jgi:hypothetical protein
VVTLALAAVVAAHPSATQVPAEAATACTSPLWPALARFVLQDGTAVAPRNGEVFFYGAIYSHDRTLNLLLQKGYPYPR